MRKPISGSERSRVSGAIEIGAVDPHETIDLAIILRPNPESVQSLRELIDDLASKKSLRERSYITRLEFANRSFDVSETLIPLGESINFP